MRLFAALVSLGSLLGLVLMPSGSHAQTKGCLDQPGEPHPYGPFTFITNSRVDKPTAPGRKSSVIACVTHDDKDNPLRVHWMIPGPDGWVPPGRMLESLPRDTDNISFKQLEGCLLYGNRGDTTFGKFLGIEGDDKRVDDEKARGCRAVVANPRPMPSAIERIFIKVLNFVPSDAEHAKDTMLQVDGTVGIEPTSPTSYRSVVTYLISRYGDSKGNPSELTARPVFPGATERLLPAFLNDHKPPITLGEKGEFAFPVTDVVNPMLDYAAYQILDRAGRPVGSISFPVLVPGSGNQR